MKKAILFVILAALIFFVVNLALSDDGAPTSDPKQVFEKVWEGYRGKTTMFEKEEMWMVLDNIEEIPGKRNPEEMENLTKKRWGVKMMTRYLKYDAGLLDKMYIHFTFPPRDNGTQFLIWRYPDKVDDVWMYTRANRRVRRLAAPDQEDHFVGSSFTYEDIRRLMGEVGKKTKSFTFKLLPDGMISVNPKGGVNSGYSERRFKINTNEDKTSFEEVRYYKNGQLAKIQQNSRISYQNGLWRPLLVEMYDVQNKFSTLLYFPERKFLSEEEVPKRIFEINYMMSHGG